MNEFCYIDKDILPREYFALYFTDLKSFSEFLTDDDKVVYVRKKDKEELALTSDHYYEALIFGFKQRKV